MVEITGKSRENVEYDTNYVEKDNRLKLTSVRVSVDDWEYCKENGLQFAELIREKIRELRSNTSGHVTENVQTLYKKLEEMQKKIDKFSDYLTEKNLVDDYINNFAFKK
jgi:hypothetical protein